MQIFVLAKFGAMNFENVRKGGNADAFPLQTCGLSKQGKLSRRSGGFSLPFELEQVEEEEEEDNNNGSTSAVPASTSSALLLDNPANQSSDRKRKLSIMSNMRSSPSLELSSEDGDDGIDENIFPRPRNKRHSLSLNDDDDDDDRVVDSSLHPDLAIYGVDNPELDIMAQKTRKEKSLVLKTVYNCNGDLALAYDLLMGRADPKAHPIWNSYEDKTLLRSEEKGELEDLLKRKGGILPVLQR